MSGEGRSARQFSGHRARLALIPEQIRLIDGQAHAARALWNLLHEWWTMLPKDKRTLVAADAAIRQARKDIDWLGDLPAQAAQAVLKAYLQAWRNCWEGRAKEPRFKARFRTVMSVDVPQGGNLKVTRVHRRWGAVNIPKVGRVRFRWTKELPVGRWADSENRITGARLVNDALGWHIAFRVRTLRTEPKPHPGPEIGIDVGVSIPLALSDGGVKTHGEWLTPEESEKLLRLERLAVHRQVSREHGKPVSKRLERTYDQIRVLRARAKRRHLDWQHQMTSEIADKYGVIVVEDLAITNMVKSAKGSTRAPGRNVAQKSGLNRAISEEAWGRTATMLEYKAIRRGGRFYRVPAPGTSQRCSACGVTTPGSRRSQAAFRCKNKQCGWTGNADHNAARNVLYLYRVSREVTPVAGRAVVRRARRVQSVAVRQTGISQSARLGEHSK